MHRIKIKDLLVRYMPSDKKEIAYKDQILSFIEQEKDCFERTLKIGHITASCWLVNADNTHALLTHHKKLNMWIQLGGHCDGDSDVLAVALKEAQEESGIMSIEPVSCEIFDICVHYNPPYKDDPGHYHYDIRFLLKVMSSEEVVVGTESHDLMWIDKDIKNLPTDSVSVVRMFNKWKNLHVFFFMALFLLSNTVYLFSMHSSPQGINPLFFSNAVITLNNVEVDPRLTEVNISFSSFRQNIKAMVLTSSFCSNQKDMEDTLDGYFHQHANAIANILYGSYAIDMESDAMQKRADAFEALAKIMEVGDKDIRLDEMHTILLENWQKEQVENRRLQDYIHSFFQRELERSKDLLSLAPKQLAEKNRESRPVTSEPPFKLEADNKSTIEKEQKDKKGANKMKILFCISAGLNIFLLIIVIKNFSLLMPYLFTQTL